VYRELPNATTGLSPYQLVYGKVGRGPLSVLKDVWADDQDPGSLESRTYRDYFDQLRADLELGAKIATENADVAQRAYNKYYNLKSRDTTFSEGEQVLILLPDSTNRLKSQWIGPCVVISKISPYSYRLLLEDGSTRTLYANHLR